jgi:general secretion pathway protein D
VTQKDSNGNVIGFQPGRGLSLGYFEDGNLQAVLRALESQQKANILSTPNIVALDNQEASLLVGQNVPFITGQATGSSSSTDNPFTTIERQDIGISLIVTPRINQGDSITLAIKQKIENIAPSISASDIVTNKREIVTSALIKDNQTLVLGGLIDDQDVETEERVPVLGSLPFVGKLFSSKSKQRVKKNLMVFIHPVILKDDAQIADITQSRYKFMQERQAEYNRAMPAKAGSPELKDYSEIAPKK